MTDSRRRPADPYGRPQPHLVTPTPTDRLHTAHNTRLRAYLVRLLEDYYDWLFQSGVWADVHIHLRVSDGTVRKEFDVTVIHHHDMAQEEE